MWRRPLVKTIVSDDWPASDRGLLTFRAGTLVHMLFNRHEDEMSCFLGALAGREPRRQAFPRCFTTFGSWDSEMQDYEWIVRFPTRTIRVEPRAVSLEKSSVSDAQVHTWLALLDIGLAEMVEKLFRGVYADRAERSLKRALTLDPTEPLAVAAAIRWLPGERPRFDALTAGVVAAHPLDWRAWRLRAGTPGLAAEEANRACEEMVKLVPDGLDEAELSPCSRD
jgi:hypothetical protein